MIPNDIKIFLKMKNKDYLSIVENMKKYNHFANKDWLMVFASTLISLLKNLLSFVNLKKIAESYSKHNRN